MDVFGVPQKNSVKADSGTQNSNANASGEILAASFNDILRNADGRLDTDAASLIARVDQSIASRQPAPAERSGESNFDRRDGHGAEKSDFGNRHTDGSDKYGENDTQRAAIYDERPSQAGHQSDTSDRRDDSTPAGSANSSTDGRSAEQRTRGHGEESAADAESANGYDSASDSAPNASSPTEKAASNSVPGSAADDQAGTEFTANVLATQLFTNRDVSGANSAPSASDKSTAGDVRSTVANTISDAARGPATQLGPQQGTQTQTHGQKIASAITGQTPNQIAGDVSANGSDGKFQPTTDPSGIVADAAKAADGKSQQAAVLSRLIGEGNAVSVRAAADAVADTLVSRPSAALSASAATVGEAMKPIVATGQNATLNVQAAAVSGAEVNPMATQADRAAAQAAGSQGTTATTASARGIAQLAGAANSGSGQAQSGGGESLPGNGTQSAGQTGAGQQAAQTRAPGAPRFTLPQHTAADQVSVQITKALKAGIDRINIQLRPENMGRVDVRMELTADGRISAVVTADNKETLEMLQRDSRELERALQDAGLQTDEGSLAFNLREQNPNGQNSENPDTGVADASTDDGVEAEPEPTMVPTDYAGGIRSDGHVDIRA
ncbi:MAG: flagellar hook-length control protein FliK [Rhodospirillales bacterium]|nr:flagellar hook-length control protein FliK [Rhodospirillales bacterium]